MLSRPDFDVLASKTKAQIRVVYNTLTLDTLQRAFRSDVVQGGFALTGVSPFSTNKILDQVPGFGDLPPEITKPCKAAGRHPQSYGTCNVTFF